MSGQAAGIDQQAQEEEALRLARELRQQVSDLREQAKAVGHAIAGHPVEPFAQTSSVEGDASDGPAPGA